MQCTHGHGAGTETLPVRFQILLLVGAPALFIALPAIVNHPYLSAAIPVMLAVFPNTRHVLWPLMSDILTSGPANGAAQARTGSTGASRRAASPVWSAAAEREQVSAAHVAVPIHSTADRSNCANSC